MCPQCIAEREKWEVALLKSRQKARVATIVRTVKKTIRGAEVVVIMVVESTEDTRKRTTIHER